MSPRPRDRILANLESIYREAYARAKESGDQARMQDLDAAFQREQLILEVLMDIRDLLTGGQGSGGSSTLNKIETIRNIAKLR